MSTHPFLALDPREAGLPGSGRGAALVRALERRFDAVFGARDNPLRQLGGLGFFLFWLIAATGAYLYVFYDTRVEGAWASVERLTRDPWHARGLMRSLHRYASDAFAVVVAAHLLRELALGRFRGFRWFTWVTGVPTLWVAGASGIIGYWLVWDEVAQFVAIAVTEWFAALPGFGPALVRNFIADAAMSDRLFSLLVFLHIGLPLLLLLAMWVHVQRLTGARTSATRAVATGTLLTLVALSLAAPTVSAPQADLQRAAAQLSLDWFYLAPFPLMYAATPGALWALAAGATLLLAAAPWLVRAPRPAPARVDAAHCNGCTRCFADCPYAAVTMAPHPSGRGRIAVVDDDLCAACGLCAGACPSSTPFRSAERLVTGIDLPQAPLDALREALAQALSSRRAGMPAPTVVFTCQRGAGVETATGPRAEAPAGTGVGAAPPTGASTEPGSGAGHATDRPVIAFGLTCAGQLPPAFVEYALRHGAAGVVVAPCPAEDCEFRFGARWVQERLAGVREPRLREAVDPARLRVVEAAREERARLRHAIDAFARDLARRPASRPAARSPHRGIGVSRDE